MTAGSKDFIDAMTAHLPIVFAFVLTLAFILLLVTFRSIVVPIKAIVLNLLSVGSAYGVLVLVFQDGHGERLLDFESVGGIAPWIPLFLFVILFGLSMDYHVLILSRIREAVDRGMSNDDAVAHGIKSTAGVVTSAALVMVAVFGSFALGSDQVAKQIGVGLAAAILIDATHHPRRPAARHDEAARHAQLVPAQAPELAAEVRARAARSRPPDQPGEGLAWRTPSERRRSAPAQPAKHSPPIVPVTVSSTPAAATAATPSLPRIRIAAVAPTVGPIGSGQHRDRDQQRDGVEQRGIDADGVQHQPVAKDLCEHGEEHERDDAAALAAVPEHREPAPDLAAGAQREPPQAGAGRRHHGDGDHGDPPGEPERDDQGERGQRGERRLDGEDRELGGDQRRHLRTDGRRGPAQRRDSRRDPEVRVEHAPEHLHAGRAIEHAARDRPTRHFDAQMPGLAARQQRDDLQQHGDGERPQADVREGIGEVVAAPGEHDHEDRGHAQRARDGQRGAVSSPERAQPRELSLHGRRIGDNEGHHDLRLARGGSQKVLPARRDGPHDDALQPPTVHPLGLEFADDQLSWERKPSRRSSPGRCSSARVMTSVASRPHCA